MSVDQTKTVDAIGVDKLSGDLVLTITDHMEWESNEHLLLLQEKINTYLSFVESGELLNTYKDAKDRDVVINVICQYSPDKDGLSFFSQVADIIKNTGIKLSYDVI